MMRADPAATVSRPPDTAASRSATPTGRFHSQTKKCTVAASVFCMMNTSRNMRIRNPTISADQSAAARVNLTADSGETRYSPGVAVGSGGVPFEDATGGWARAGEGTASDGRSGDTDGSLVMAPSLPLRQPNETTAALTVR